MPRTQRFTPYPHIHIHSPDPVFRSRITREEILPLLAQATAYPSEVEQRLHWFLHFAEHRSISATCRRFGIARTTFHRWAKRFDPRDLQSLEDLPLPLPPVRGSEPPPTEAVSAVPAAAREEPARDVSGSPCHGPAQAGFLSRLRGWNWVPLRRAVFLTSVLLNLSLLGAWLATALVERANSTPALHASPPARQAALALPPPAPDR